MTNNILWQPIPNSSQVLAVDTRCDETLYAGTRGGGKTETQLMAFAKYVGMGYGTYWRGIIFDKQYKNLDDVITKSKRIFGKMPNTKYNINESKWTWSTGEELLFRRLEKDDDYWLYHGHEYCLPDCETIVTENGSVEIKDIAVGDKVLTLDGYHEVSRKFDVGVKDCVKVEVYTLDGNLHSVQFQSANHRLLTTSGVWEKSSLYSFQTVVMPCEMYNYTSSLGKISVSDREKNLVFFVQKLCEQIYVKLSHVLCENNEQNPFYLQSLVLDVALVLNNLSMLHSLTTSFDSDLKSYILSLVNKVSRLVKYFHHLYHPEQFEQYVVFEKLNLNALQLNDCVELHKALNYLGDYFYGIYQYGVLVHKDIENAQHIVPLLQAAIKYSPDSTLDVVMEEFQDTHFFHYEFIHPYKQLRTCRSSLDLCVGFVRVHSLKNLHCYDIEVECTNHYITTSGLVNKNCFIGFNELTKYPTSYLYDTIMSCNRSGFVPDEHPKYDKDGNVYYLPPIPLMFFSTTNPHGAGHNWVKQRFIDVAPYGTVVKRQTSVYNPKTQKQETVTRSQVTLFSSYIENIYLSSSYIASLLNYPDLNIRRAWVLGSWDIISGGAFGDLWDKNKHVVCRFAIPNGWYIDRCFDWGSTHPFSVGWWAESNGEEADMLLNDGRWVKFCPPKGTLVQFYEWYGTERIGTNKGLKMSAGEIAEQILAIEKGLISGGWIKRTVAAGAADNQIYNSISKDTPSIGSLMEQHGVYWKRSDKSSGSRKNGLQLFRDRLGNTKNNSENPHIYFTNNCIASISTIPILPRDEKNQDDVDTNAEDHAYDMVRYRILQAHNEISMIKVRY